MNARRTVPLPRTWALARRLLGVAVGIALLAGAACTGASSTPSVSDRTKVHPEILRAVEARPSSLLPLIVREATPRSDAAERLVEGLGGTVTHDLSIIGSFSARLPAGELDSLLASPDVLKVWGDGRIRFHGDTSKYDKTSPNYVWQKVIDLGGVKEAKGSGVTVALLDTGVLPTADLGGRILASADFTSEGDGIDRYGHGTHMATVIAGDGTLSKGDWRGAAPKANLVSVKVAGRDGSTDVSVVIAGLQWIVAHREQFKIRVLNLSFGTDSKQSYSVDPLNYAIEQVWFSGVFVAVAAGNGGPTVGTLNKPADDPYVLTVGGVDVKNTTEREDDLVADFSSIGPTQDGLVKPDLVAPAITIVGGRNPGSTVDEGHPDARVGDHYFKGTGTSQATAIVSGIAALMFEVAPKLTPDVAKATLMGTVKKDIALQPGAGAGLVYASDAAKAAADGKFVKKPANQGLVPSSGLGSLELSRGSYHVEVDMDGDGVYELIEGEIGFGWTEGEWSAGSWRAGSWRASSWRADQWSAGSWRASSWSAGSWRSDSWTASSWRSDTWSASSWRASSWRDDSWSESAWAADAWS